MIGRPNLVSAFRNSEPTARGKRRPFAANMRHQLTLGWLEELALRSRRAATPRTASCWRGTNGENRPRPDVGKVRIPEVGGRGASHLQSSGAQIRPRKVIEWQAQATFARQRSASADVSTASIVSSRQAKSIGLATTASMSAARYSAR